MQAHLGLSRHANPALINSQHFPLLLSRLAFLLPPSLSSSRGPFPSLGLTDGVPGHPALLQPLTKLVKRRRCHMANPRAANSTEPRQPPEHQHSRVQVPLSPDLKRKPRSPSPGCSPTRLASLSPVLIRAPKLTDSEPKLILFQSDFVRALFAFKNLSRALSSYRWEKTTGGEVNPRGGPGGAAALGSRLCGLSVGCLSESFYLSRTAGLGCFTSNCPALLFPHSQKHLLLPPTLRALGMLPRGAQKEDVTSSSSWP